MQQPVRSHTVVEDGMSALAKSRRAKLRQSQIQQPEPENITLVASDHSPAAAQQTLLIAHSFSIPRSVPRLKPLFRDCHVKRLYTAHHASAWLTHCVANS